VYSVSESSSEATAGSKAVASPSSSSTGCGVALPVSALAGFAAFGFAVPHWPRTSRITDRAAASIAANAKAAPHDQAAIPAATTRSRPAAMHAAPADVPHAMSASVSQTDVASRSWSGSTAQSDTATTMIDETATHQPMPPGPRTTPVASETAAATSRPTGTTPSQAVTMSTKAIQPQARKRPLKSSRRCRRISRTISATPAATTSSIWASQTCNDAMPSGSNTAPAAATVRANRPPSTNSVRPKNGPLPATTTTATSGTNTAAIASDRPPTPVGRRTAGPRCFSGSASGS